MKEVNINVWLRNYDQVVMNSIRKILNMLTPQFVQYDDLVHVVVVHEVVLYA